MNKVLDFPLTARLLRAAGVEPVQYKLLLNLFSKLRDRQEFELGAAHISVLKASGTVAFFSAIGNVIAAFIAQASLANFVFGNYVLTAILVVMMLLNEAVNTFLNPIESAALAHQPIRERSYFAAKLTYLLLITAMVVFPLNIVPAVVGLNLNGARWFYPLLHLTSAYLLGLLIAFIECGVLGLLMRVIPVVRVRNAILWLQIVFFGLIFSFGPLVQLLRPLRGLSLHLDPIYHSALPLNWFVALALLGSGGSASTLYWPAIPSALLCGFVVCFGISSLTQGALTRVHSLLRSGSGRSRKRNSWFGGAVRLVTGKPSGRAGFAFVYGMAKSDWTFRRSVFPMLMYMIFPIIGMLRLGIRRSPFLPGPPSPVHFLPHICGFAGFLVCSMITFSDQHGGAWIFLTAPLDGIRSFVQGIFWALWLPMCALPVLLLPAFVWFWNISGAVLFVAYNIAVISFYLSCEILLIDGLPFANPPKAGRNSMAAPLVVAAIIAAVILVGLQWRFIFQSHFVAFGATLVFAGGAYLLAKASLRNLEVNVMHNLHLIASGRAAMFTEIG